MWSLGLLLWELWSGSLPQAQKVNNQEKEEKEKGKEEEGKEEKEKEKEDEGDESVLDDILHT